MNKVKVYLIPRPQCYILAYLRNGELERFTDEPLTVDSAERRAAEFNKLCRGTGRTAEVVRV